MHTITHIYICMYMCGVNVCLTCRTCLYFAYGCQHLSICMHKFVRVDDFVSAHWHLFYTSVCIYLHTYLPIYAFQASTYSEICMCVCVLSVCCFSSYLFTVSPVPVHTYCLLCLLDLFLSLLLNCPNKSTINHSLLDITTNRGYIYTYIHT